MRSSTGQAIEMRYTTATEPPALTFCPSRVSQSCRALLSIAFSLESTSEGLAVPPVT